MILNSKASAYGDRSEVIGEWMSNTNIFLYHNGWGIIAGGIGTKTIKLQHNGINEEKYIKLRDFVHGVNITNGKIEKYISPSQIKDLLGQNFYFASTIVSLSKENG